MPTILLMVGIFRINTEIYGKILFLLTNYKVIPFLSGQESESLHYLCTQ